MGRVTTLRLLYTQPRIYKTIKDIKKLGSEYKEIISEQIGIHEYIRGLPEIDFIKLILPLTPKLNRKIDRAMGVETLPVDVYDPDSDFIAFQWTRSKNKRYWELDRSGRPLCQNEEDYNKIIDESKSYDECICPKKFVDICKDLTSILKQRAIKYL